MKQEDKELLLVDLCTRLPHRVMIKSVGENKIIGLWDLKDVDSLPLPYLRPMSSMTEEEYKELKSISSYYGFAPYEYIGDWCPNYEMINWLNAHHFDYRGLIEKGLAIEVTEENNPYKD